MILLADQVESLDRRFRASLIACGSALPVAAAGSEAETPPPVTDTKTDTTAIQDSGNGSVRG